MAGPPNSRRVLVVDDSDLLHLMYDSFFKRSCIPPYEVHHAKNRIEALAVLENEDGIDFIVLDIEMPIMNGVTFLMSRQVDGEGQEIPVLAVSTKESGTEITNALNAGANAHLKKPFTHSDLHQKISQIIE